MHKTFQILNLGWFEAPQSFKSEKLRVTKHQIKKARIALKHEPNYINKNGWELEMHMFYRTNKSLSFYHFAK